MDCHIITRLLSIQCTMTYSTAVQSLQSVHEINSDQSIQRSISAHQVFVSCDPGVLEQGYWSALARRRRYAGGMWVLRRGGHVREWCSWPRVVGRGVGLVDMVMGHWECAGCGQGLSGRLARTVMGISGAERGRREVWRGTGVEEGEIDGSRPSSSSAPRRSDTARPASGSGPWMAQQRERLCDLDIVTLSVCTIVGIRRVFEVGCAVGCVECS